MTILTSHTTGTAIAEAPAYQEQQQEARPERHGHQKDLAERAAMFAQNTRTLVRRIPKTIASMGDCRRVIRASGDMGSAYLDADKALSKQEFLRCMQLCCREARQCKHWLYLLDVNLDERSKELHNLLIQEAEEMEKIFGAILFKVRNKHA